MVPWCPVLGDVVWKTKKEALIWILRIVGFVEVMCFLKRTYWKHLSGFLGFVFMDLWKLFEDAAWNCMLSVRVCLEIWIERFQLSMTINWMQNPARSQQHQWATSRSRHLLAGPIPKCSILIAGSKGINQSLRDIYIYTTIKSPLNHYKITHKFISCVANNHHSSQRFVDSSTISFASGTISKSPAFRFRTPGSWSESLLDSEWCDWTGDWRTGWKQALHPRYL